MKKLLLVVLTFVLATVAYAQASRQLAPMKAGKSDIILTQPEGELHTYMRSGGCVDVVYGGFVDDLRQDGAFARVVVSPDGKTAYFQNIISRAATGAWVKGNIQGDQILIPYGQMYYWFEDPKDSEGNSDAPYGLKLAEVDMKGSHTNYTVKMTGNAVFRIKDNWKVLELEGTSADLDNDNIVGLALVYTDKYNGEWSYYMDYETVYTECEDSPVTPPEGIVTERYSIAHGIYGHFVDVAFARDEIYIRGVSQDYVPNAWIMGTFDADNNKIHFPLQLAGSYQVYLFYFLGVDIEKLNDNYGGTYAYTLNPENTEIVFDYDPETRCFWNNDRALIVNNAKDGLDRYERYPKPMFRPYTERAAKPAAPAITEIDDRFWAYGYSMSTVAISVPLFDEDGNFMDPSKVFYSLYVDEDDPYLLYQDEYPSLPFDEVEEIPYLYTDNQYIFPKSEGLYIFQNGFERMGIKSIYYGGNDRQESEIYYTLPRSVGIDEIKDEGLRMKSEVFDLSGRRVAKPTKGLYIQNGKKYLIK